MKMTPLAQGSGVPAASDVGQGSSVTSDARTRAIAAAEGKEVIKAVPQQEEQRRNPALDQRQIIKMKTQASVDRHIDPGTIAEVVQNTTPEQVASPTPDVNVEPAPTAEEKKPLSPQAVALAKARRALQMKEAELSKREAELAQRSSSGLEDYVSKADLKERRLSALLDLGITYDQLTQDILSGNGPNPEILALKNEIQSLKTSMDQTLQKRDEQQKLQVLSQIRRDVDRELSTGQYKAAQAAKASQQVVDLIDRTWMQDGELLDVSEAAALVEKQIREEAMPFVDLLRPEASVPQAPAQQQQQVPGATPVKVMKTLSNRDSSRPVGMLDSKTRARLAAQYGPNWRAQFKG